MIGVDASADQIAVARARAEPAEVRLEWHRATSPTSRSSAPTRSTSRSAPTPSARSTTSRACSARCTACCATTRPFVFSLAHPLALAPTPTRRAGAVPTRSAAVSSARLFDPSPIEVERGGEPVTLYPHTIAEVFTGLHRAGFRVDMLLEPRTGRRRPARSCPRPSSGGPARKARERAPASDRSHRYRTVCDWSGSTAVGYDGYDRGAHRHVPARRAPPDRSAPTRRSSATRRCSTRSSSCSPRPSSCQLLSFLAVAARARIDVLAYDDDAEADMPEDDPADAHHRDPAPARASPSPRAPTPDGCTSSSRVAHEECFIANSLTSAIDIAGDRRRSRVTLRSGAGAVLDAPLARPVASRS